jgi:glyoxylase-like metal-dependent hydrolase (beta-lactamase superfamily II)
MRVLSPPRNRALYTSNVFLILGNWSRIEDVNVLVDVGADPNVLEFIAHAPTGIGKRKLDAVVLTHRHYDHTTMLSKVKRMFAPTVLAWGPATDGVDRALRDGERLRLGDELFEVVRTPGHTDDSICLYGLESGALFVGDTPVVVNSSDGSYEPAYVEALQRLASRPVSVIHFGHGDSLATGCNERLAASLRMVEGGTAGRSRG